MAANAATPTAPAAQRTQRRWSIDDLFAHRYTVIALLFVLVVCLAIILWLVFSMSRYEREGDTLVQKFQYKKATDKYIKALQRHTITGKDRVLFKIAQTLAADDEETRAVDFLFQLMRQFPEENFYHGKAKALAASILRDLEGPDDGGDPPAKGLSDSYHRFRKTYRSLLAVLVKGMHKEGNRLRAKRLYEQYRDDFTNYAATLKQEYREAVDRRATEKIRHLEERDKAAASQQDDSP